MPELPEVETIARHLREGQSGAPPLPGMTIDGVTVRWPRHIARPALSTFRRRIRNRSVQSIDRRGKYLVLSLDEGALLVHLKMSGDLVLEERSRPRDKSERTVFRLRGGWELRFNDARKFGKVFLVNEPEQIVGKLGPEPLADDFTAARLARRLSQRRRQLKPLLLDQTFLAGLGNIYADEALHQAGIHPLRLSDSLSHDEATALWRGIRQALEHGLRHNGASIDWVYRGGEFQNHFRVYARTGQACPACGTPIRRIVVGQRSTHFCPTCQPERTR